jgi:hypothetical protein
MKAITICQPYAWLITLPESDPRHKRAENRRWYCSYRGPILIHAGKSLDWLDTWEDMTPAEEAALVYGAIVGKADMVACIDIELARAGYLSDDLQWVKTHQHAEGPFCFILEHVEPCKPIYCPGAQGIWDWHEPSPQPVAGRLF